MIVAIDVHYRPDGSATAAALCFSSWESGEAVEELVLETEEVAQYVPGQFYLRELPCIRRLLAEMKCPYDCIVIDGYVFLGKDRRPGLGMHLWNSLDRKVPVIGVAKSRFWETPEEAKLFRGSSTRPLYITAVGVPLDEAKACISCMNGSHRIPALLKRVDRISRERASAIA
jgi:deoxyribonuclease V